MLTSPDELASIPPTELAEEIDLIFLRAWEDPQSVIPVSEPRQQESVQAALGLPQDPAAAPPTPALPTPILESGSDTQSPLALSPVAEVEMRDQGSPGVE